MISSDPQADILIRRGFHAQQRGDGMAAKAAYEQALALQPEHPAALQLLGLIARRQGDVAGAETLLRRSLLAQVQQPHVWNNLGNLLDSQGRGAEALECFERALLQDSRYADAHYNRARLLLASNRPADASHSVAAAIAASPAPVAAHLQLQAQIQDALGDTDVALATLDRALQRAPQHAALHHNRATLLQRRHRHAQALIAHEAALALGLDAADAHYNHGNTLQSLGRHGEAVDAYRRALQRNGGHALALYDLARLRWRLGEQDFDAELLYAAAQDPKSPLAPGLHGHLLWRADRHADAAAAFKEAMRRSPEAAGFHDGLARCLARLGQVDSALAAHQQAVERAPLDASLHSHHATTLLMAGRLEAAQTAAARACELAPEDQHALAVLGLAWRHVQPSREAWLNNADLLVAVLDLPAPQGFADMAVFNAALARELRALHHDRAPPVDQTLRGGTQTLGDIFEQRNPLVDALKVRIAEAVDRYVAGLPGDAEHPFLRRRTEGWRFTDSWSSRLGNGGFHTNHVHPHGWISSAYYVVVPESVQHGDDAAGWLQLGEPDFDAGFTAEAVRRRVQPRPGRLVLFPSMFWHGTLPFVDGAERLSIAFDVMPR